MPDDPAWGTTKDLLLDDPIDEDGDACWWEPPSWYELVDLNDEGELHHGSSGSRTPDTVVLRAADRPVALADAHTHTIDNQYCWDSEYYLVLRLRDILDPDAWRASPWPQLAPGDVFLAYDKFHGNVYSRTPADESSMSYGGDWSDLQAFIDDRHPRLEGPRPTAVASPTSLLRAVRDRDEPRVRALLAAGADPEAGLDPPHEALRSVSVDRDATALAEAIYADAPGIVDALLAAGARLTARSPRHYTPLQLALANRALAVVPVLLRHGADPDVVSADTTAREIAASRCPEALALLPPRIA
jgi:hypothetical protein